MKKFITLLFVFISHTYLSHGASIDTKLVEPNKSSPEFKGYRVCDTRVTLNPNPQISTEVAADFFFIGQDKKTDLYNKKGLGRVFFVSNEERSSMQAVQESLIEMTRDDDFTKKRVLVGVSGADLLNVAVNSKIDVLIVLDNNPRVIEFWTKLKAVVSKSTSRQEAGENLSEAIRENPQWIEDFEKESSALLSFAKNRFSDLNEFWLSSDENFFKAKTILSNNAFFYNMSIVDLESVQKIKRFLKFMKLEINVFYVSNVIYWAQKFENLTNEEIKTAIMIFLQSESESDITNCPLVVYSEKPKKLISIYDPKKDKVIRSYKICENEPARRDLCRSVHFLRYVLPRMLRKA